MISWLKRSSVAGIAFGMITRDVQNDGAESGYQSERIERKRSLERINRMEKVA